MLLTIFSITFLGKVKGDNDEDNYAVETVAAVVAAADDDNHGDDDGA